MKTKLIALAALVLGVVSCQNDFDGGRTNAGGEVNFSLGIAAPELNHTRAGVDGVADKQNAWDSAFGAIDYLQAIDDADVYRVDWKEVDLRYSLEVYDVENGEVKNTTPIKDRMVKIVDKYEPVMFDLRLVPNREYRFVVFADFVNQGASDVVTNTIQGELGRHHNIGTTLQDITVKNDGINKECTDAYFAKRDIRIENSAAQNIVLQRPYGKIRVITTDLAELNLNVDPARVVVTYDAHHPVAFNAVTGNIDTEVKAEALTFESKYNDGVCKESLANHFYTAGYDDYALYGTVNANGEKRHTHMTLFTDYILATEEHSPIHFKMSVYDGVNAEPIKTTEFDTEIPVQRNHLTTIIGNVLTTGTQINVTIDDNFANKDNQYYVFEALVNGGELTLEEDYVIGRPIFVEADAVLNLNGHTIKNAEGNENTDVIIVREGATLTINGEGTIEAVSGNDGYAVIAEGTVIINGGDFKSGVDVNGDPNAVVYARGNGKVFVNGGVFHNEHTSKYVLNKKDADRATTTIEVRGGLFQNFDPANNAAEGAETSFMADGFTTVQDGDWYKVVAAVDYVDKGEYAEVYTAKGLLWWASRTEENNIYGLKLMSNITLPAYEVDYKGGEYFYTTTPITVTDGIPSGSNWPALSDYETSKNAETDTYVYYGGVIDGNNKTISGLRINHDLVASGFLCWTKDAKVDNLTFNNAVVYNKGGQYDETYTGVIIGRCWDGSHINNCHVTNSSVLGKNEVGGIAGRVYRRTIKTNTDDGIPQELMEDLAYVTYCTTDENTTVKGVSSIGGIVGMNYGCVVGQCINNAQVSATGDYAGGIVGYNRSYTTKTDGYIIACRSTDKATIKSKFAGGVAGYVLHDNNHLYAKSWIVGCASESTISGTTNSGGIIGNANNATITSSWAVKKGASKLFGKGSATNNASYIYNNATDATQVDIDAMNAAIEAFNVSDHNVSLDGTVGAVMLKRWALVNGVPVLQ
ncbi:MAG: DUF6562 domain-containing protein [Alistipes sp.]|nr:DUF6562 domain-containing protein [Alistipes sp.]